MVNRQRLLHHRLQPCALRSLRVLMVNGLHNRLQPCAHMSAGGQPPPQSSQSAGGQLPPQSSSTMCTQSAGPQPPARPLPSKTGASLLTSPEGPHIIAYIHNLSLLKRNKRNTIDYTTLTLQTDATTTQPALRYSKTKRKLLHEHETKRAPIKISCYTKSGDKTKVVINDKTLLTNQMTWTTRSNITTTQINQ